MADAYTSRATQGWGASQTCAYCHGFAQIPPLIRGSDGVIHLNPDYEMVKRFHLAADPFGGAEGTIPAGESQDFTLTVPAEDASLGDLLVNELMALFTPANARNLTVQILNLQSNRFFMNAGIYNTLIFGDAFLNCCLPCCFLIQATNSTTIRITNNETVPVEVRIVARGKRFLPKDDELRARMLMYWNMLPTYPYFLTLDDEEIVVPAGDVVTATMSVIGTGDFEVKYPRCEVLPAGVGAVNPNDILLTVAEGVGREWQSDPLPMGAFVATPTLDVAGFPGDLYRAAAACHCPPFTQLFKRNTRVRHTFENVGANDAIVRLTYAGCFHKVDECPPGRSIDRIRSLEPTIGPIMIPEHNYCPPQPEYYPSAELLEEAPPAPMLPWPAPDMPPAPAPAPAGTMYAPVPGGAAPVVPGGALAYMQKYYQPGPGGMATAQQQYAAAHGLKPGQIPGISGLGSQTQLQPGQYYYDPIVGAWRRV
jgi:hypothetical protein